MKYRVFCDFDGTLAANDVGNAVFTHFGEEDHWWHLFDEWKNARIDGREMWRRQAAVMRMTKAELDDFTAMQPIDPAFPAFVRFCNKHGFPVYVVSDGMDAYIERILAYNGLSDLHIRSNHLDIDEAGRLSVSFPYYEKGCGQCANCKGNHIRRETKPDETSVFIGDGYSDLCALDAADIVFAKDALLKYCRENNISCVPFKDFKDIQKSLAG